MRIRHTILFFLLLNDINLCAQQHVSLSVNKYTQSAGLSSYNITQITKDKQGFLWVASQDGLSRFDGNSFSSYTKNSLPNRQICAPQIRKIIEDSAHNILWVLPSDNGMHAISTITGNVKLTVPIPKIDTADWNITMAYCNNKLWIGSFSGLKIYSIPDRRFIPAPELDTALKKNAADFEIRTIIKDNYGNMWVCYSGYGIVIYNGSSFKKIREIRLNNLNDILQSGNIRFNNYTFLDPATLLLATSQGLRQIKYDQDYNLIVNNHPASLITQLNTQPIESVEKTGNDTVWVAGQKQFYAFDNSLRNFYLIDENLAPAESNWLKATQSIYTDGAQNCWLGCEEGIAKFSTTSTAFRKYFFDQQSDNRIEHLRSIAVLENGNILAGQKNGFMQINNGRFEVKDSLHLYHHIFSGFNDNIFLFREDGIFIFKNNRVRPVTEFYKEFDTYRTVAVNSHIILSDSTILFGTENDNGLLLWNYKKKKITKIDASTKPALGADVVNNIYRDKEERIWVLSDNLITVIDKNLNKSRIISFAADKNYSQVGLFFDMCEANGRYWIASYGNGIIKLDSNFNIQKLITSKDGLCNDGVYNIFNIGDSDLVITTNSGLSVYKIKEQRFKNYFKEDGLHSNAFEEVAATFYKNKIYAGGINGFTIIDPSKFTTNTTPPLFYFTEIKVTAADSSKNIDTTNLEIQSVTIPSKWLQTTISFTGINYSNPNRVTYQYRIQEQDTNWVSNGSQDFISLIGLGPGKYHVEVKAANEDGYWCKPKTLVLIVNPKWFETAWFKIAVSVLLVGLFYAFYHYRITQLKKQEEIRHTIAADLHDDIGATLNSLKIFTHMAETANNKTPYFIQMKDSLLQATMGLRDMIWVLDDNDDTVEKLVARLKQFTGPLATVQDISIDYFTDGANEHTLNKTEKRNILLIIKESVNNCIKYAGCKNITVRFSVTGKKLSITIKDDGKGFDMNNYTAGNGLVNIQHRAKQIRYSASVQSSAGNGTEIIITPL